MSIFRACDRDSEREKIVHFGLAKQFASWIAGFGRVRLEIGRFHQSVAILFHTRVLTCTAVLRW